VKEQTGKHSNHR